MAVTLDDGAPARPATADRAGPAAPLLADAGAVARARRERRRGRPRHRHRRLRRGAGADPRGDRQARRRRRRSSPRRRRASCTCRTARDVVDFLDREVREGDLVVTMGCGDVWMLGDAALERIRSRTAERRMSDLARAEAILRAACGDRGPHRVPDGAAHDVPHRRAGGPVPGARGRGRPRGRGAARRARRTSRSSCSARARTSSCPTRGSPGSCCGSGGATGGRRATATGSTAGGAMPLPALAGVALRHGLVGLEFGVAIPASARRRRPDERRRPRGEMADVVETVDVFRLDGGARRAIAAAEAGFALPALGPARATRVVVGATLALAPGDPAAIRAAHGRGARVAPRAPSRSPSRTAAASSRTRRTTTPRA